MMIFIMYACTHAQPTSHSKPRRLSNLWNILSNYMIFTPLWSKTNLIIHCHKTFTGNCKDSAQYVVSLTSLNSTSLVAAKSNPCCWLSYRRTRIIIWYAVLTSLPYKLGVYLVAFCSTLTIRMVLSPSNLVSLWCNFSFSIRQEERKNLLM